MRSIKNGIPTFTGDNLANIAYPLGGMGAGMFCLTGSGAVTALSVRHEPFLVNEPSAFAAIHIHGGETRVLEGPVAKQLYYSAATRYAEGRGAGCMEIKYGLPRLDHAEFSSKFPFATIKFKDRDMPLEISLIAWSPFTPLNADDSSLPIAAFEYSFKNLTDSVVDAVFYYALENPMRMYHTPDDRKGLRTYPTDGGFVCMNSASDEAPWREGYFSVTADGGDVHVNTAWHRGGWVDAFTMLWNDIERGVCETKSHLADEQTSVGGCVAVPLTLQPCESRTVTVRFAWYVPNSNLKCGKPDLTVSQADDFIDTYKPWYSGRFDGIDALITYWRDEYSRLRADTLRFTDCFYNTDMPSDAIEAVAANLTILKSTTVMRQTDGRLWCWEGSHERWGSCHGTCTHVWNYAQAICHLFPDLERTLRETEFFENQTDDGHQNFRAVLPIRKGIHHFHAAADGQLGGLIKLWRDYTICGDIDWLKRLWPPAKKSIDYCITTWDPDRTGLLWEPHHNTYDIEFWGPDSMCGSFYVAALKAASLIAAAVGDDPSDYNALYCKARAATESELWNGEYFYQKIVWNGLRATVNLDELYPEERARLVAEGPKYQYGDGCLSDGVLGVWMALTGRVGEVLDADKVTSHLLSVYRRNHRKNLSDYTNLQRSTYALGDDGGLLLCTWPGEKLQLPFVYSDEVWTGIEYQVATHLIMSGHDAEGIDIIRTARARYDGTTRNPYNEYECGNWYARALSSFACVQAFSGAVYCAPARSLTVSNQGKHFLITATGYGTLNVSASGATVDVVSGSIDVDSVRYEKSAL